MIAIVDDSAHSGDISHVSSQKEKHLVPTVVGRVRHYAVEGSAHPLFEVSCCILAGALRGRSWGGSILQEESLVFRQPFALRQNVKIAVRISSYMTEYSLTWKKSSCASPCEFEHAIADGLLVTCESLADSHEGSLMRHVVGLCLFVSSGGRRCG